MSSIPLSLLAGWILLSRMDAPPSLWIWHLCYVSHCERPKKHFEIIWVSRMYRPTCKDLNFNFLKSIWTCQKKLIWVEQSKHSTSGICRNQIWFTFQTPSKCGLDPICKKKISSCCPEFLNSIWIQPGYAIKKSIWLAGWRLPVFAFTLGFTCKQRV